MEPGSCGWLDRARSLFWQSSFACLRLSCSSARLFDPQRREGANRTSHPSQVHGDEAAWCEDLGTSDPETHSLVNESPICIGTRGVEGALTAEEYALRFPNQGGVGGHGSSLSRE